MKTLVVMGLAVGMLGVGMPAMATDDESTGFFALNQVTEEATLDAMTDSQLTTVEGAGNHCDYCTQVATVLQGNSAEQSSLRILTIGGGGQNNDAYQRNNAYVNQSIYQRIN
jgi:hypothetical protein